MKKTLVIIILAVYIASIAVVNFFGLQVRIFDGITYVSEIQCNTVTLLGENGRQIQPAQTLADPMFGKVDVFIFDFIPSPDGEPYTMDNLESNPNIIQLNYEVWPHLADVQEVEFIYDKESGVVVYHELSKSFIVLKSGEAFDIILKSADGSNITEKVKIFSRAPKVN